MSSPDERFSPVYVENKGIELSFGEVLKEVSHGGVSP